MAVLALLAAPAPSGYGRMERAWHVRSVTALPLCGTPFSISGKGFPRVLHIGKLQTGQMGVLVGERTNRAFIFSSEPSYPGQRRLCRSSLITVEATTGRFIRIVPLGIVSAAFAVDNQVGHIIAAGYPEGGSTDWSRGALTVLDTWGRLVVPARPFALCPCPGATTYGLTMGEDTRTHHVFVGSSHRVITFDAISGRLLVSVPVKTGGNCDCLHLLVDEQRGRVFATTLQGLTVFSSMTGSPMSTIDLAGQPGFVAEDRRTGRIFTEALTGPIGCGHPPGGPAYVLAVLDADTGKLVRAMFDSCAGFWVTVDEPARRVYVTIPDYPGKPGKGAVLDSADGRVLQYWSGDPPPPVLLVVGLRTGHLYYRYVRCSRVCQVDIKVFDSARRRLLRTLPIPTSLHVLNSGVTTAIADAAGRVFVSDPPSHTVTILRL